MGPDETADFIRLLNSALDWTTDESMLGVLPIDGRDFGGQGWSKLKSLTYLGNNVDILRRNYVALETGSSPDPGEINPVLETARLKLVPGKEGRSRLLPALIAASGDNPGTSHIRWVVQRAFYSFARYAEFRCADPAWPEATPFRFRVLPCAEKGCGYLTPSGGGTAVLCAACLFEAENEP